VAAGTGDDGRALLLAAGGGALGLRIAEPELEARWASEGGEQGFEGQGAEPGSDGLRSAVGMVWRSVVLWIALFAMLTLASWLGR
jgi:adenosylcobinamide-phosphate synthase